MSKHKGSLKDDTQRIYTPEDYVGYDVTSETHAEYEARARAMAERAEYARSVKILPKEDPAIRVIMERVEREEKANKRTDEVE